VYVPILCMFQQMKQLTDLDWGRDLAPYFTLPGLIHRIDGLLHTTCNLRLVPAQMLDAQQQQQQQQGATGYDTGSAASCRFSDWGSNVLHLLLLTEPDSHQQQQQQGTQVLGHILLELVSSGFPSCTLLQLPTPAADVTDTLDTTASGAHTVQVPTPRTLSHHHQQHHHHQQQQSQPSASGFIPGSVVLRVPVPAASRIHGFGQQQQQQGGDVAPLALPGPAALQALLHELGHALAYLCPYKHLQHLLPATSCSPAAGARAGAAGNSSGNIGSSGSSRRQWLFDVPVGVQGLCLLCGPPVGIDVREVSSHLFEHWVRHPASLRVSRNSVRAMPWQWVLLNVPCQQNSVVSIRHTSVMLNAPAIV
jgi:hypothetical protein